MIDEAALLADYPAEVPTAAAPQEAGVGARMLVVLDDDPTGTQSIAGLPVLTSWAEEDFAWAIAQGLPAVYVLTNTRSLDQAVTETRTREVVTNALSAAATALTFVSRGDSILRGHFPLETDIIAATLRARTGEQVDGVVIVPAFPDAGRITIGGVHYLRTPSGLLPVAESEFAADATFGYASSDLRDYVEEKTAGRVVAAEVVTLDLSTVRSGPEAIAAALAGVTGETPVVVDIVTDGDLRSLATGLARAESAGKAFLYRVGPPFVRAMIGQTARAPLTAAEIYREEAGTDRGGLIVVGSHVGLTTRQLARLTESRALSATIELDLSNVLDPSVRDGYLEQVATRVSAALDQGEVVLHTSRALIKSDDADESLDISRRVSAAIVRVVELVLRAGSPRFVVAKGGITSSDVATHGLGIRRAMVRGPMLPGLVSLWEPVDGPAVGVPYIVFAGNVDDDDSLAAVVDILSADTRPAS